jgi:transposase
MDERLQFVARRLAGEAMAELCREFGISRKTGYKIFDRYQECGLHGLTDRSRRPYRYAHQLPFQVENFILNVKREHPSWGARKIRERLLRRFSRIPVPAKSTIHAVLDRYGLVERRGRVRRRAQGTALSLGQRPNELWCTTTNARTKLWTCNVPAKSINLPRARTRDCRISTIPSTIKPSWSRVADASVWAERKSTSARSLPVKRSASQKCTTISGWSALWIMIWGISIWRRECSNRWKIRLAQKCYPCLRYVVSPMCPGWTLEVLVGSAGLEPATSCL